ncbi:MAG: AAA family ATPase [Actinobacteria bacterium]|nr:AAA family ATPase [Actinomycetota bacterium]
MRLHRIRIENFRGVASCEVDLSANGVTIIEGPNEVGKSSLAEAVDLLFDYPHDSRSKSVTAVRPVDRDAGPEVEVELTTGPYHLIYSKRWFRQPETRLSVTAPVAQSLVGRTAHDKMEAILDETLDRDLYRALRFIQGDKVGQGHVGSSTTLIGALDRASAGGSADPEAESTLWEAIQAERSRYFTQTGKISQEREKLAAKLKAAEQRLGQARQELANLEAMGEEYRATLVRLEQLADKRERAQAELGELRAASSELERLRNQLDTLQARVLAAERAETSARQAQESRDAMAAELARREDDLERYRQEVESGLPELSRAQTALAEALEKERDAEIAKQQSLEALSQAERDLELSRARVSQVLLTARLGQLERARDLEATARKFLESCKVTTELRAELTDAMSRVSQARIAHDTASPSVVIEALADVGLSVDSSPIRLAKGAIRHYTVAGSMALIVEDKAIVQIKGGAPIQELRSELKDAQEALELLVDRYGLNRVDPLSDLNGLLDRRRDADRQIEEAIYLRSTALQDLTEEELRAKHANAERIVNEHPTEVADDSSAPISSDEAERCLQDAKDVLVAAQGVLDHARLAVRVAEAAEGDLKAKVSQAQVLQQQAGRELENVSAALAKARELKPDSELEEELSVARSALDVERRAQDLAGRELEASNPEGVALRLGNVESLIERLDSQARDLGQHRIELETALRIKGQADLQASISDAETEVENLAREHLELERRADAASYLFETFANHRDAARLAYVAPYRLEVEKLAKLVFGPNTSIEVDPTDFKLTARSLDGVVVPFESLSTGTREQLAVLARLACAILVNPDGDAEDCGVPVILDDALGYSDPDRLRLLAPAFSAAAKRAQVLVMTSTPERYSHVGNAKVVRLPDR